MRKKLELKDAQLQEIQPNTASQDSVIQQLKLLQEKHVEFQKILHSLTDSNTSSSKVNPASNFFTRHLQNKLRKKCQ